MDSRWLDTLPANDPLAAQNQALRWLKNFVASTEPRDHLLLNTLMRVDAHCAANATTLSAHYINTSSLSYEDEERLWEAVYSYHHHLSRAYLTFLPAHQSPSQQPELINEQPLIVAHAMHYLGRAAKWHYFRYQPVPAGHWLRMHQLYALAEQGNFTNQNLKLCASGRETSCSTSYLRALMLDTLSRTDMSKKEIALVDEWLDNWVSALPLDQLFEEEWQLFYVDLAADRGGRRIRNFEPTPNCRYWDTDTIVRTIERAKKGLSQGERPAWISLDDENNGVDYLRLFHHLLAEWSRDIYQRQRRSEERDAVRKKAEAIHGIFSVCQHVKNIMFARHSKTEISNIEMSEFDTTDEHWVIENESPHGFGATVDPEVDTWVTVGRLIALNYEKNKDMTVIGVVRNINQQTDGRCYVGIEALSHTPTYVLLCGAEAPASTGQHPVETLAMSTLAFEASSPFPGLYLPRNDSRKTPSTLVIPIIEFVDAGIFEMRMENHPYLVRLGKTIEQKDDWVRVEVKEVKTTQKKGYPVWPAPD